MSADSKPIASTMLGEHERRSELVADAGGNPAPTLFFDCVRVCGLHRDGIAHATLEMVRHVAAGPEGKPLKDIQIVAHLRMGLNGVRQLCSALQEIEALAERPKDSTEH